METAPIKTKLHTTALGYARYGFPIFPLAPPSKKPLAGSHGFEDATSDLKAIETWWSQNPECNIGLSLGPAKRLLLDLDYRHSPTIQNRSDFVERYGPIPDNACEAISGSGGRHVYFDFEGQVPAELEPGVELKCQGSYSVLPPSIHPAYIPPRYFGWEAYTGTTGLAPVQRTAI